MTVRSVVVACLLALGASSTAQAMCAPETWVGTPSGSHVPTRGTLYVHDGSRHLDGAQDDEVPVRWIGAEGSVTQVRISSAAIAVSYVGPNGTTLEIDRDRFVLDDTWRAPADAPRALGFRHNVHSWTCSSTDSLTVTLDQTSAAIRVRWTFEGKTSEWIVPANGDAAPGGPLQRDPAKEVELGKIDCGGTTVPPDELSAGGHLELRAIRLDGTEIAVEGLPPTMTSEPLLDEAMRGRVQIPMPRELPIRVNTRLIAMSFTLIALAFGWILARHGRKSAL